MNDSDESLDDDAGNGLSGFDFLDVPDAQENPEDTPELLFSASNAEGSVTVSALMNGCVHHIGLSRHHPDMTEAELADEIVAVAQVAVAKGRAGQYELVSGMLRVQGQDEMSSRELLTHGLGLPTPEEAIAAEAALAARSLRH